jgi:hypothetical protein
MDELRTRLAPLTDWLPPSVREWCPVEVWWLIYLALVLASLVVLGHLLRKVGRTLFVRRPPPSHWERQLREDLDECPLPVRPWRDPVLTMYHVPVRMRLVIVAPVGKEIEVDAIAVEKFLDRVVPGLGEACAWDRPLIRVWPPQLSQEGFVSFFNRCTPKKEGEDSPSRWILIVGRTHVGRQPVMLGLGLWAEEPNTIGRITLGPHQWLDVLRFRRAGG